MLAVLALLLVSSLAFASCGNSNVTPSDTTDEGVRLPPGITEEELKGLNIGDQGSGLSEPGSSEGESQKPNTSETKPSETLSGARITVVHVTGNGSNKKVINSSQREVLGDYLEVELALQNTGDELVDLTQYSFRLESPGIIADDYRSYYGDVGVLGKYVSEHVISAVLLDYADLTPVLYKLKKGEALEGVFLFFDLNPLSTAKNEVFNLNSAGNDTYLVIHKLRGSDSGEEVQISLAGFTG